MGENHIVILLRLTSWTAVYESPPYNAYLSSYAGKMGISCWAFKQKKAEGHALSAQALCFSVCI